LIVDIILIPFICIVNTFRNLQLIYQTYLM
jgi:hypothetical protein